MLTALFLSNTGVTFTLILGVVAILLPQHIQTFVSIRAIGKEGSSEVRATYGGFFAGIAMYALYSQSLEVFLTIGAGWVSASIIRLISLFKGAYSFKNMCAVFFEGGMGALCSASSFT